MFAVGMELCKYLPMFPAGLTVIISLAITVVVVSYQLSISEVLSDVIIIINIMD